VSKHIVWLALAPAFVAGACGGSGAPTVRVAYFPNIAHATPMTGLARGTFQEALGPGVTVKPRVLNAGPEVIEGLFAGEIDIAYVGPNPAINGYVRSQGEALRIVAGAASGGASFVVTERSGIRTVADLKGKRIATPGIGNTQDVSLRSYLRLHGLKPKDAGGTVQVIPMKNPDILTLFSQGEIDGAWVPEPWATRLILEAGGRLFIDERELWPDGQFAATVVAVRTGFLRDHPDLVARWLQGHVQSTRWLRANPQEAQALFNQEMARVLGKGLPDRVLAQAWAAIDFESAIPEEAVLGAAALAYEVGYLGQRRPDLGGLFVRAPLEGAPRVAGRAEGARP